MNIPGINGKICSEYRLNSWKVRDRLIRWDEVYLETSEDRRERERQRQAILYDAHQFGLEVSIQTGWILADNWVKFWGARSKKPEGALLYLRVAVRNQF